MAFHQINMTDTGIAIIGMTKYGRTAIISLSDGDIHDFNVTVEPYDNKFSEDEISHVIEEADFVTAELEVLTKDATDALDFTFRAVTLLNGPETTLDFVEFHIDDAVTRSMSLLPSM